MRFSHPETNVSSDSLPALPALPGSAAPPPSAGNELQNMEALGCALEAFIDAESRRFGANQARVSLPTLTTEPGENANECAVCIS